MRRVRRVRRASVGRLGAAIAAIAAMALSAGAAAQAGSGGGASEEAALAAITAAGLHAHLRFLADDALEGRGTASRGLRIAAAYVASRYRELGLLPAGDDGSYLQRVPLHRAWAVPAGSGVSLVRSGRATPFRYLEDFGWSPSFTATEESLEAPLVAVGFGVSAPELRYDDYAGVDVRGKVVLVARGSPAVFANDQRAYYSSNVEKLRNAAAHGAVGILVIRDPAQKPQPAARWRRLARSAAANGAVTWDDAGAPHGIFPELRLRAMLSDAGLARVLGSSAGRYRRAMARALRGTPASFATRTKVRARQRSRQEIAECVNVAAVLPGADPALSSEHVVFSAHLDHLGLDPAEGAEGAEPAESNTDLVNNGAYDNASGIAAMLEVARAFAALPSAPRRSVLFLAVTGEEKGLQGAEYFAAHPTVAESSLVADFNLDMFLMLFPVRDVVAFGAEHSTLAAVVARAAERSGFTVSPDPYPEEVIFVRSDQYAFVKAGIPAVFLVAGFQSGDPATDGEKATREWLVTKYHSPQDDLSQPMDLDSGVRFARANFLAGLEVANAATRPTWNPGDFFGQRFGRKEATP